MKKLILLTISLTFITAAVADIQEPPGHRNSIDKYGRGLSNLLFGWIEIPATMVRDLDDNSTKAFVSGPARGFSRAMTRMGWGFYEVFSWPAATTKGSYRNPLYHSNTILKPRSGFSEYPPDIGFQSGSMYTRLQKY